MLVLKIWFGEKKEEGQDSKSTSTPLKRNKRQGRKKKTHLLLTLLLYLSARIRRTTTQTRLFSSSPPFLFSTSSPPTTSINATKTDRTAAPTTTTLPLLSSETDPATAAHEQPSSLLPRPSSRHLRQRREETEGKSTPISPRRLVLILTTSIVGRGHEACDPPPTRRHPERKLTAGDSTWLERASHPPPALQLGFDCFWRLVSCFHRLFCAIFKLLIIYMFLNYLKCWVRRFNEMASQWSWDVGPWI